MSTKVPDLVDVTTQEQLDQVIAAGNIPVCRAGFYSVGGSATVRAGGSATVRAGGSATVEAGGSATVRAWGSATVRAWGSATVRAGGSATVEAGDSATVRAGGSATVRAWGSATVEAGDSATVEAWGSATVRAGDYVAVTRHGTTANITGGVLIQIPDCNTPDEWCAFYNLPVTDGKTVLYKAVTDDLKSGHGLAYPIGKKVTDKNWKPHTGCGDGLHLCPRPAMARRYHQEATRFLACEVALDDLVIIDSSKVSDKAKARTLLVLHEVNEDGEPVSAGGGEIAA